MDTLSIQELVPYLRERGVLPDDEANLTTEALGGGISNDVFRVRADGICLVVKRPYSNLAVEDDWPADVARVHNEAAAARAYEEMFRTADITDITVPSVIFEDSEDHVIGIECAPEDARMWKAVLLEGSVDHGIAAKLGRALGVVHAGAAEDEVLRSEFEDYTPFEQLRLDPYHRTVARRHPDVADAVRAEIDRILDIRRTLVHGDYSPKNVLIERAGDGDVTPIAWVLDFEVAHWGDPAFDLAFMLNHLLINSVHNAGHFEGYVSAARRFYEAYADTSGWNLEAAVTRELAVLMLARVDGKSSLEYTDEVTEDALRSASKHALVDHIEEFNRFLDILATERAAL